MATFLGSTSNHIMAPVFHCDIFSLYLFRKDTWYRLEERKDLYILSSYTFLKTHTLLNNALIRLSKIKRTLLISVGLHLEKNCFLRVLSKWNSLPNDVVKIFVMEIPAMWQTSVFMCLMISYHPIFMSPNKDCFYISIWNICYIVLKKKQYCNFYCQ